MAYSHAPTLTALKALPKEPDKWHNLFHPLRERYSDAPRVVQAEHPREMLHALHDLAYDFLRGDLRPGERKAHIKNYESCIDDYYALAEAVTKSLAAA